MNKSNNSKGHLFQREILSFNNKLTWISAAVIVAAIAAVSYNSNKRREDKGPTPKEKEF
jgi:hypothetical protein